MKTVLACVLALVLCNTSFATDVFFSNRVFVRNQPVVVNSFGGFQPYGFGGNAVIVNGGFATFGQPVFVQQFGRPVVIQNFRGRGGVTVFSNGFCY